MQGVPQQVVKTELRQQFGDSRRANTAENVCAMTCHSPVKGAGVLSLLAFCCPWRLNLSLDLQQKVRLVGLSQPLC